MVTLRITPRSTSEITGISGSGISSSAAQTSSTVTIPPPARFGAHLGHLGPELRELRRVVAALACCDRLETDPAAELGTQLGLDDAQRERPQLGDRVAEARLVGETARPDLGVQPVVDLLAVDLRHESGELRVVTRAERVEADRSASS